MQSSIVSMDVRGTVVLQGFMLPMSLSKPNSHIVGAVFFLAIWVSRSTSPTTCKSADSEFLAKAVTPQRGSPLRVSSLTLQGFELL